MVPRAATAFAGQHLVRYCHDTNWLDPDLTPKDVAKLRSYRRIHFYASDSFAGSDRDGYYGAIRMSAFMPALVQCGRFGLGDEWGWSCAHNPDVFAFVFLRFLTPNDVPHPTINTVNGACVQREDVALLQSYQRNHRVDLNQLRLRFEKGGNGGGVPAIEKEARVWDACVRIAQGTPAWVPFLVEPLLTTTFRELTVEICWEARGNSPRANARPSQVCVLRPPSGFRAVPLPRNPSGNPGRARPICEVVVPVSERQRLRIRRRERVPVET